MKKLPLSSPAFQYVEKSFGEWLDILGYSSRTIYALPIHVREFLHGLESEGITQVEMIEPKHFHQHYRRMQQRMNQRDGGALNGNSLNKHRQALITFAEYLRKSARQPLPWIELRTQPAEDRDLQVLSVEQVRALFAMTSEPYDSVMGDALAQRDRALLVIFYGCGLRRNEGLHLDVGDVDLDRKVVHVRKGKGHKQRMVPINRESARMLEEYMYEGRLKLLASRTEGAFFISMRGLRQSTESMHIRLLALQQKSDDPRMRERPLSLHGLRHSIATHLLHGGMSLEKIARFLGHSSLESTQIYTHLQHEEDEHVR